MEIEDVKSIWKKLDERLQENNFFQEKLIRDIIQKRGRKSITKLLTSEIIGVVTIALLIPFILISYQNFGGKFVMWDTLIITAEILCIIIFFWLVFKTSTLMKVDFSKNIANNVYIMNRYNIYIKWEKMIMNIVGPLLLILMFGVFIETKASISMWVMFICVSIVVTLMNYWIYKRYYEKNIASILESLNELKELKED